VWLGNYALQTGDASETLAAMNRVLALDHTRDPYTTAARAAIAQARAKLPGRAPAH
jgi:cytochrome c-type biogenesis protein CcmH/NrfG